MFTAMGARPPVFAHEALLIGTEGKLSKRLGSLGVAVFREQDIEPIALIALLARIGTSDPVEPVTEVEPLLQSFDFTRFGRAPARFDEAELAALNQRIVHLLRQDEHTSELQSLMNNLYAAFCLKNKKHIVYSQNTQH